MLPGPVTEPRSLTQRAARLRPPTPRPPWCALTVPLSWFEGRAFGVSGLSVCLRPSPSMSVASPPCADETAPSVAARFCFTTPGSVSARRRAKAGDGGGQSGDRERGSERAGRPAVPRSPSALLTGRQHRPSWKLCNAPKEGGALRQSGCPRVMHRERGRVPRSPCDSRRDRRHWAKHRSGRYEGLRGLTRRPDVREGEAAREDRDGGARSRGHGVTVATIPGTRSPAAGDRAVRARSRRLIRAALFSGVECRPPSRGPAWSYF